MGQAGGAPVLLLAEGYATAASVHQATRRPVAVCFDAGNLVHVAKALRERWPALPLLLCADDDMDTKARTGKNRGPRQGLTNHPHGRPGPGAGGGGAAGRAACRRG